MFVPFALTQLFANCAPAVGSTTMSAVVVYESGAHANAIGDNTTRRSYFPTDRAGAEALATRLLRAGHNIDAGYAQINSANFATFGLNAGSVFDPCTNISTGSRILQSAYVAAARTYGPGQLALMHALSAYNTGGFWAGLGYAHGVYATAATLRYQGSPLAEGPAGRVRAVPFHRAAHRSRASTAP